MEKKKEEFSVPCKVDRSQLSEDPVTMVIAECDDPADEKYKPKPAKTGILGEG